jgi:hypothetical protein
MFLLSAACRRICTSRGSQDSFMAICSAVRPPDRSCKQQEFLSYSDSKLHACPSRNQFPCTCSIAEGNNSNVFIKSISIKLVKKLPSFTFNEVPEKPYCVTAQSSQHFDNLFPKIYFKIIQNFHNLFPEIYFKIIHSTKTRSSNKSLPQPKCCMHF